MQLPFTCGKGPAACVGKRLTVLIDEVGAEGAVGRSSADAPEIDGVVYVEDGADLRVGDFTDVVVHAASEHDLHAHRAS